MPDGWEVKFPNAVNPTNGADGIVDFAGETNVLGVVDPDGLSNSNEYIWGTNPEASDTDGDSMPDGWEVMFPNAVNPTNGTDGADHFSGETNSSGVVISDGLVNSNEYRYGTDPGLWDTDGDGFDDGVEVNSGTDPTDSNSVPVDISGFIFNAAPDVSGDAYLVLNLASNGNPFASYSLGVLGLGGLPYAITNVPSQSNYWPYAFIDVNTNATYETWEPHGAYQDGTNSITPTADLVAINIIISKSAQDTDGDGLTDYDEEYLYGTSSTTNDTDDDGFWDGNELFAVYKTDPVDSASFPANIGGLLSYTGALSGPVSVIITNAQLTVTNGPFAVGAYSSATNLPTLTNYYVMGYIDENTNGVMDLWEPRGETELYPLNLTTNVGDANITIMDPAGDTDGDGLTDYDEHYVYFTNPSTNDTDGDSMLDFWEVAYSPVVSPTNDADKFLDPDTDFLTNLWEHANNTDPGDPDTDGDGATDYEEVTNLMTDPINEDTDGDGMWDGWEVDHGLNPLSDDADADLDGDGISNGTEYTLGTEPNNSDTDGDGLSDGEEVNVHGTDPTNDDTDGDKFKDGDEITNIVSMATNSDDPIVVDGSAPLVNLALDPGSYDNPYNIIQHGVDAATSGYTVLVRDGVYNFHDGNQEIDPGGKSITIRSRNGYDVTRIDDPRGAFVFQTSETSNTIVQGFTIQTGTQPSGTAGIICSGASPTIKECRFFDCLSAGVLFTNGSQALIIDCLFEENEGGIKIEDSSPTVERCTLLRNTDTDGAGIKISGALSEPRVVNCVIAQNIAGNNGGGIYIGADATPLMLNCTVADNVATNSGGGFYNAGDLTFWNSVLWDNQAPVNAGGEDSPSLPLMAYSCLQKVTFALNYITNNPQFVAGADDYQLQSSSPCIDIASDSDGGIVAPEDDRDGKERISVGGSNKTDMGAYEFHPNGRLYIQYPGGSAGDTVTAGLPATVNWTWTDSVGTNLTLEFTYDDLTSPTWQLMASNVFSGTNGNGSYVWNVPQTNTSQCYVRAADSTNSQIAAISSNMFAIADGMRVLDPNGGETFYIGNTMDVAWASSATTNPAVDILLSTNGDQSITSGVTHVGGGVTNSANWVIAADSVSVLTTNGRVRVVYEDGSLPADSDESDESFSILGLVINQSIGGVATGAVTNVLWNTIGAGDVVNIALSTNVGLSYFSISNGVASVDGVTNSYSWTVGNTPSSNAILRIESVSDASVVGYATFKITDGISVTGLRDLDGDGMPDSYEELHGLNPLNNSGDDGADGDADEDGFLNSAEMLAGTDPLDDSSFIGILGLSETRNAGGIQPAGVSSSFRSLRWAAVEGRDYRVEVASTPMGPWASASETITATNTVVSWDDLSQDPPPRFFRIIVLP